jgi:hypothetical protein
MNKMHMEETVIQFILFDGVLGGVILDFRNKRYEGNQEAANCGDYNIASTPSNRRPTGIVLYRTGGRQDRERNWMPLKVHPCRVTILGASSLSTAGRDMQSLGQ